MIEEIIQKMIDERVKPLERRINDLERQLAQSKGLLTRRVVKMAEAVKILHCSRDKIASMIEIKDEKGRVIQPGIIKKAKKIGRPWLFDAEELRQIAEQQNL